MWAYQMLPLVQAGYRCIAFDRRGQPSAASDPGRGYDFDTLADDLAAVLETLDLHNVVLVGHSMGCGESHAVPRASRPGARRPDRVDRPDHPPFLLKTTDNPKRRRQSGVRRRCGPAGSSITHCSGWRQCRPFVVPETSDAQIQWVMDMMLQTSLQAVIEGATSR